MYKILMLDDDSEFLEVARTILSLHNFKVITTAPIVDIKSVFLLHQPDLIVLDYLMGDVNGGEVCSSLKKDKITGHVPVIILTAYDKVIRSLGSYGCDVFLSKPLDFKVLIAQINKLLHVHSNGFGA